MKKLTTLLLALYMTASTMAAAYAAEPLEYTIDGTGGPEYGNPTSIRSEERRVGKECYS